MEKPLPIWSRRLRREREHCGWSQERVAQLLDTNPKTVGRWERGEMRPGLEFRVQLCKLFKKSVDELGFFNENTDHEPEKEGLKTIDLPHTAPLAASTSQIDWGEAPLVRQLYGRDEASSQLEQWIVDRGCQVVAVLGGGGIGKTSLAVNVVAQIHASFDYVFWRSLQNAPTIDTILQKCILFLSNNQQVDLPNDLEEKISLCIEYLRKHRCLLIFDNLETVLQGGDEVGHWREGYEGYGSLIKRLADVQHRSCLILTSREKPKEVAHSEGHSSPVRSLQLGGLELDEGKAMLQDTELFGRDVWRAFIYLYSGNPLALKIVSGTIREIFRGDITRFLKEGMAVFGDVYDLLDRQFHRLSALEQEILYWLAIERAPTLLEELRENIVRPVTKGVLLRALNSLQRRYMLETSDGGYLGLQPVIMEYVTNELVECIAKEIDIEEPSFSCAMRF